MAVNQQHGEVWRQLEVSKWTWKHGPWAWDPPENMRNISSGLIIPRTLKEWASTLNFPFKTTAISLNRASLPHVWNSLAALGSKLGPKECPKAKFGEQIWPPGFVVKP